MKYGIVSKKVQLEVSDMTGKHYMAGIVQQGFFRLKFVPFFNFDDYYEQFLHCDTSSSCIGCLAPCNYIEYKVQTTGDNTNKRVSN